jgi:hypothetical protein
MSITTFSFYNKFLGVRNVTVNFEKTYGFTFSYFNSSIYMKSSGSIIVVTNFVLDSITKLPELSLIDKSKYFKIVF